MKRLVASLLVALLLPSCGGGTQAADVLPGVDAVAVDPGPATDSVDVADTLDAPPFDSGTPADIPCVPDCTNRRCGDDGCGGLCGTCPYPDAHLECVDGKCLPPMVDIPAGTFWMGCNEAVDGECDGDEKPRHEVSLSAYRIDKYEVSAGAYKEYLAAVGPDCANPGDGKACWEFDAAKDWINVNANGKEGYPANGTNWFMADGYCQWAGRSLCTEAQWEYAARGTDGRKFPWGNGCPSSWGDKCTGPEWTQATAKANCYDEFCHDGWDDLHDGTAPVGSFPLGASPFGVLDMAGNVSEWVNDAYGSDYYCNGPLADTTWPFDSECSSADVPYQTPWNDPTGPDGLYRIRRGSHHNAFLTDDRGMTLRACQRAWATQDKSTMIYDGFRCCGSLEI